MKMGRLPHPTEEARKKARKKAYTDYNQKNKKIINAKMATYYLRGRIDYFNTHLSKKVYALLKIALEAVERDRQKMTERDLEYINKILPSIEVCEIISRKWTEEHIENAKF